jgi:ribonuclease HI
MSVPAPHFHLFSTGHPADSVDPVGRWRFVLRTADGEPCLEATDDEPAAKSAERLQLLAIVRGLESLEQPSRVTLLGASRSIRRGLRQGLDLWRENNWHWERYGQWTPVKNADLWRRIDQAMAIHTVECRELDEITTDDLAPPPVATMKTCRRTDCGADQTPALRTEPIPVNRRRQRQHTTSDRKLRIDPAAARQLHRAESSSRWAELPLWRAWLAAWAGKLGRLIAPAPNGLRRTTPPSPRAKRPAIRRPNSIHSP